ncbi:hypothetical protein ATANTOWER_019755 [Ataeniobius toweri]|uniref:Uncharacterized protein n=1 Tax=Ataeniobius toweri TaxID=208326 RepID=A0ABU7BJK4_9TELE|nr:hypothetical protein [Ataeniobius toweri]
MSTAGTAAAVFPTPSSATALSPRLAAAPSTPSSLAPAQGSVATPDKLEERLRFFAGQIMSFRRISFCHPSLQLKDKLREMEQEYETAVRQFYCSPPSSASDSQRGAAVQPMPCL